MNSRPGGKMVDSQEGFTLLEVMVAIAILAIALTTLVGNQNQSMLAAERTDFSFISALLAEQKMNEILAARTAPASDSGDFEESFTAYNWKLDVASADFGTLEVMAPAESLLLRLELTVSSDDDRNAFTMVRYLLVAGR